MIGIVVGADARYACKPHFCEVPFGVKSREHAQAISDRHGLHIEVFGTYEFAVESDPQPKFRTFPEKLL